MLTVKPKELVSQVATGHDRRVVIPCSQAGVPTGLNHQLQWPELGSRRCLLFWLLFRAARDPELNPRCSRRHWVDPIVRSMVNKRLASPTHKKTLDFWRPKESDNVSVDRHHVLSVLPGYHLASNNFWQIQPEPVFLSNGYKLR